MKRIVTFFTGLMLFMLASLGQAHDARPVAVSITETLPGIYQYSVRVPPTVELNNVPDLVWPANCAITGAPDGSSNSQILMSCEGGLAGSSLSLDWPLYNPSLATFYRLTTLATAAQATLDDTNSLAAMVPPSQAVWQVPEELSGGNVALEYLGLGIEHILGGLDHLLFVLGLLVIARTTKRILLTISGFTLAHSITLSLSALGFLNIPIVPVEATIALSIVFLAFEISQEHNLSLTYRFPLIISFGFGLLHGLGFASALGEIGMVPGEILLSLLFFNLGVEAGQVLFIFVVIAALVLIQRALKSRISFSDTLVARRVDLLAAYVIGIPASYWMIERVMQIL